MNLEASMTERAVHDEQVAAIDRLFREITWHGQKHAIQTLTRPGIGLTLPQMVTLLAIHDSGSCRMGALADATQQSGGTLTGIVDRLIDDGLVERLRGPGDRRVVEVALTPAGQARVQQVILARREDMSQVLSQFDDADLGQFERLLGLFLQGVRDALAHDDRVADEVGA
jgi:DNA-binding MarR family transcriptional regulator